MFTNPLISIIIPCYNIEVFVCECIESIVHQTYKNWELILVVGGQDRTPEICDEYAKKDKRIKCIHDNQGLAPARNSGFFHSSGDWITYIDGDDTVSTNMLEILVNNINIHPNLDMIFWTYIQEINGKQILGKWNWNIFKDGEVFNSRQCKILATKVLDYSVGISPAYCKLLKRKWAFDNNIIHDKRLIQGNEGVEFSLKAFYYAENVLFLLNDFYHYRYNPNSISKKVNEKNGKYITDCYEVMKEDIARFEHKDIFEHNLEQHSIYSLIALAMNSYFNPENKDKLSLKAKRYVELINSCNIYKKAIKNSRYKDFDKFRKVALFLIKHNIYIFLQPISSLKHYLLKKGYFNY